MPDLIAKFNFLLSDCPEKEILHCHNYEYNRELKEYHLPWLGWREKADARTFNAFLEYLGGRNWSLSANVFGPYFPFYLFPEWPDDPYLSIDAAERRRRWKLLYGRAQLRSLFALTVHYPAVQDCVGKLKQGKLPIVRSRNDLIAAVAFPMAESKEAWVQRLREAASHLDRIRARLWPSMQAEINKKKSVFSHKKAELKALGALRLIKEAGGFLNGGRISGTVTEKASDICRHARVNPLFSTHRRWSVAARLAQGVLEIYKLHLRSVGVIRSN